MLKIIVGSILTLMVIIGGLKLFNGTDLILTKYYYWIGYSKHKSNDKKGAIEDYSKVLELDSKFVTAYISRGSAFLDLKKYNEAITDYNKAIELAPHDAQIYAYRGRAYYEVEQFKEAMEDYDKALTLDDENAYALYNRGLLKYAVYYDFDGGCEDFKMASDLGHDQATDVIYNGDCE